MSRCWIYHETAEPKIVDREDVQSYHDDGWADSPAKFTKTTDFGIDADDQMAVQALGETVEGVVDQLNGQLNLGEMKDKDLKAYALLHFGEEIKGRGANLLAQVEGMINEHTH